MFSYGLNFKYGIFVRPFSAPVVHTIIWDKKIKNVLLLLNIDICIEADHQG